MAQVPYGEGVPQVAPETRAGDDYQHIQVDPAAFGASIAEGAQRLGAGGLRAANFFGQVAADNGANDFQDAATKILHGDPNKTTIGPDGKPQQDLGYLGLKGRAALDARPDVEKALDQKLKDIRANLQTPEQQLQFDNFSRRYRSYVAGQIGTHADTQANAWYAEVNKSSLSLGLTHIANNPDDPNEVLHGASDVVNALTKEAELQGAQKGDDVWNRAVQTGKQMSLKTQLEAISVKDPSRAMRMLDKNKEMAGVLYGPLAQQFRERADQQDGITAGTEAIKKTYQPVPPTATVQPILDEVGKKYGISGSYLQRTWQIEASGQFNPAPSATGAQGAFQFVGSTAKQYGVDPNNFYSSADGAARLARDNKTTLTTNLGRPPTDAELYIAHQQGAGGAAKLLLNPNVRAGDLLPAYQTRDGKTIDPIKDNGGDPNAPASAFTGMWTAKFNGAAGVFAHARKASAFQDILANPDMSEGARRHALQFVNQTIAAQQIAEEADAKGKILANDQAANGYVTSMLNGQPVDMSAIANDPNLTWQTKEGLTRAIEAHGGSDVEQASRHYGPGFWTAYKSIMAPADNPERISDMSQLLPHAGPGGDLTLAGVAKLNEVLNQNRKSVNDQAVNTSKVGLLNYMKGQLSFEQDIGPLKIRDPKGEALFNAVAIPKFEAAYDKWTKDGKNPWEFLTRENVDKLLQGVRPKAQMAADRMKALGEATGEAPNEPLPPVPEGIDPNGWTAAMANVPKTQGGAPIAHAAWANMLNMLVSNPTPQMIENFNKSQFGRAGFDGAKLIKQLTGKEISGAQGAAKPENEEEAKAWGDGSKVIEWPYKLSDRSGPGPAGYLGDMLRKVVPQKVQDYVAEVDRRQ